MILMAVAVEDDAEVEVVDKDVAFKRSCVLGEEVVLVYNFNVIVELSKAYKPLSTVSGCG